MRKETLNEMVSKNEEVFSHLALLTCHFGLCGTVDVVWPAMHVNPQRRTRGQWHK